MISNFLDQTRRGQIQQMFTLVFLSTGFGWRVLKSRCPVWWCWPEEDFYLCREGEWPPLSPIPLRDTQLKLTQLWYTVTLVRHTLPGGHPGSAGQRTVSGKHRCKRARSVCLTSPHSLGAYLKAAPGLAGFGSSCYSSLLEHLVHTPEFHRNHGSQR